VITTARAVFHLHVLLILLTVYGTLFFSRVISHAICRKHVTCMYGILVFQNHIKIPVQCYMGLSTQLHLLHLTLQY